MKSQLVICPKFAGELDIKISPSVVIAPSNVHDVKSAPAQIILQGFTNLHDVQIGLLVLVIVENLTKLQLVTLIDPVVPVTENIGVVIGARRKE